MRRRSPLEAIFAAVHRAAHLANIHPPRKLTFYDTSCGGCRFRASVSGAAGRCIYGGSAGSYDILHRRTISIRRARNVRAQGQTTLRRRGLAHSVRLKAGLETAKMTMRIAKIAAAAAPHAHAVNFARCWLRAKRGRWTAGRHRRLFDNVWQGEMAAGNSTMFHKDSSVWHWDC
jgi:hypothetical protein